MKQNILTMKTRIRTAVIALGLLQFAYAIYGQARSDYDKTTDFIKY